MRRQIVAGLHMAVAGIPWWTTDIGGFDFGNPDDPAFRELLVRWFQYGVFCGVPASRGRVFSSDAQEGMGYGGAPSGAPNEVWSYGEDVYEILKKYLDIRLGMKDYIKSVMDEASENGSPVIRAMFYEFPEDGMCWDMR